MIRKAVSVGWEEEMEECEKEKSDEHKRQKTSGE